MSKNKPNSFETRNQPLNSDNPPPSGPPPRLIFDNETRNKPSTTGNKNK